MKPEQDVFHMADESKEPEKKPRRPVVTVKLNIPAGVELDLNINGDDVFLGTSDHE